MNPQRGATFALSHRAAFATLFNVGEDFERYNPSHRFTKKDEEKLIDILNTAPCRMHNITALAIHASG